jgi:hypothetical protein
LYGRGVTNPAISIKGITHHVKIAPPVSTTSVKFIANSIETIETKDIPIAVLKANFIDICFDSIKVSSAIDVNIPLTMASDMISVTGQSISMN